MTVIAHDTDQALITGPKFVVARALQPLLLRIQSGVLATFITLIDLQHSRAPALMALDDIDRKSITTSSPVLRQQSMTGAAFESAPFWLFLSAIVLV
eukprot:5295476-Pleurochrysis_carterae.AAC.1